MERQLLTIVMAVGVCTSAAHADGEADDLGLQLVSPVNALLTLDTELEWRTYQGDLPGADDQDQGEVRLTLAWPFEFDNGWILGIHGDIPVSLGTPVYVTAERDYAEFLIRQRADTLPTNEAFEQGHGHLDDAEFGLTFGRVAQDGGILMFGLTSRWPTSQDLSQEREQTLAGAEVAFGRFFDQGVTGVRLTQWVDVASGEEVPPIDYDTNETHIGLFYARNLANGWQFVSTPTIVYDWEGASGNRWLVPLGGGLARMMQWGATPVRWSAEMEYYVISPDAFGPEWQLRFGLTPVFNR